MNSKHRPDTQIVHTGSRPEEQQGVMNPPVYRASTVTFPTVDAMNEAEANRFDTVFYGLYGTPTTFAYEEAIAELEGGYRSVTVASGLAAIAVALMAYLKAGDHLLMVDSAYGPTRKFCDNILNRYGIETTYYDPLVGGAIGNIIRPETKVIFTESPGSLTFEVQDLPAISEAACNQDIKVMLDNTWSAGFYLKPFEVGVDISIQATTKYLAGHADVMLGHITAKSEEDWLTVKTAAGLMGHGGEPDNCYLGLRGMRTLSVRLERHQENAMKLANWLAARPEVDTILHPAFSQCPGHEIWQRDFTGASGLFSIILRNYSRERVNAMLDGMDLFALGYSWGGFESLIIPFDPRGSRSATEWNAAGPALRLHAGQEDPDDLIADLERGFDRLNDKV